jgi:hypothetical protein
MGCRRRIKVQSILSALLLAAALGACAERAEPPAGTSAPSETRVPPQTGVSTIKPEYRELPVEASTEPGETVPWHLIKVDLQENRIYLSASSKGCITPNKVRLTETDTSIEITVTGLNGREPCTMQHVTLLGYVHVDSIGQRQIRGNAN